MKDSDLATARGGVALVAALLVLTALTLVGHATWLVATAELAAALQERHRLSVRLSAEGLVIRPPSGVLDSLPGRRWSVVTRGVTADGTRTELSVWPVTPELFLLVGVGETSVGRPRWRVGRMFWRLNPAERLGGFSSPLEAVLGQVVSSDSSVNTLVDGDPPGWTTWCAALPQADTTFLPPPATDSLLDALGPTHPLQLGALDREELFSRTRLLEAGSGTPQARTQGGLCTDEEWNWGSPDDPAGPCGQRRILLGASGDLLIDGGAGQGTLVVAGDLTLTGTLFVGVILVGGNLRLEGGATVFGYARSGGSTEIVGGSRFRASSCGARTALSHPELVTPLRLPMGSWIYPTPILSGM